MLHNFILPKPHSYCGFICLIISLFLTASCLSIILLLEMELGRNFLIDLGLVVLTTQLYICFAKFSDTETEECLIMAARLLKFLVRLWQFGSQLNHSDS